MMMLKALYEYRNYIVSNAAGELRYRFAGSSLGFFWNIVNPVLQIIVYTFVFSNIMKAKMDMIDSTSGFSLYLCAGMFAWISFQECVARGAGVFAECSSFLKKLSVPEYVFVAQKSLSSFLNCIINYMLIFFYGIAVTNRITIYWVMVPLILLFLMLFGFGLAMLLATANVFFQDTVQIVNVVLMIWMWLTPVVYTESILPPQFMGIMDINPVYPYIHSLQQIIISGQMPQMEHILKMVVFSIISVCIGYLFTKRNISEIRDMI